MLLCLNEESVDELEGRVSNSVGWIFFEKWSYSGLRLASVYEKRRICLLFITETVFFKFCHGNVKSGKERFSE